MYDFESRVRFSETDRNRVLTMESIVDYFQDCSTFQSEDLGVGIDHLTDRDLVWVLNYWQIVAEEYPRLGDRIRVGTFPYEFKGFMGLRNFLMLNDQGKRIVGANSLWTLLNRKTMQPVRVPEDILSRYQLEEKLDMDYEPRKIKVTGEGIEEKPIRVEKHHLDCNEHVNNGQYIRIAAAYLARELSVHQLRAEYRRQAHLGDWIYPVRYQSGERTAIVLWSNEKEPYAIIEFWQKEGKREC